MWSAAGHGALLWTVRAVPDEDDDRGGLSHGPDHAAHTDHTQEGEEGPLAAGAGTLSRQSHRLLAAAGYAGAAGQVLKRRDIKPSPLGLNPSRRLFDRFVSPLWCSRRSRRTGR